MAPKRRKMRIAIVSDVGSSGGAAIAANRLASKLNEEFPLDIKWFYRGGEAPWPSSAGETHVISPRLVRLSNLKQKRFSSFAQRAEDWAWVKFVAALVENHRPDVIWMHNIHGAKWPIEIVEAFSKVAPLVWTLHDEWVFTGSCAYTFGCKNYLRLCDAKCPEQGVYPTRPQGAVSDERRRRVSLFGRQPDVHLVAPSHWLTNQVREALPLANVQMIPYYLNHALFSAAPHRSREIPRLLFSSVSISDPRKGGALLFEALSTLQEDFELHLMGRGEAPRFNNRKVVDHGYVKGLEAVAEIYKKVDLFIHPSMADNEPQAIKEAMLSGLPVVGFDHTGVSELVKDTGYLVDETNAESLAKVLRQALGERELWRSKGEAAAAFARERSTYENTAKKYHSLFEQIISARRAR